VLSGQRCYSRYIVTKYKCKYSVFKYYYIFGPIPWGHSGPLSRVVVVVVVVVDIDAQAA